MTAFVRSPLFKRYVLLLIWLLSSFGLLDCPMALGLPNYISFPSDLKWKKYSSDHFEIIFNAGQESTAVLALHHAETVHSLLNPLFLEGPKKTYLVLADFKNELNGYALTFPYPHIALFSAPPETDHELSFSEDWLFSLILHEYVHIRHLYPANGFWKPLRSIFGSWVVPMGLMPSYMHEGLAVFWETQLTQGGRGRSAFFNLFRETAIKNKKWVYDESPYHLDQLDGDTFHFPYGTHSYLLGYELYKYLYQIKGEEGFLSLFESTSRNLPYLMSRPFQKAYQNNLDWIWASVFEHTKSASSPTGTLLPARPLTKDGFSKRGLAMDLKGEYLAYTSYTPTRDLELIIRQTKDGQTFRRFELDNLSNQLCFLNRSQDLMLLYLESEVVRKRERKFVKAYSFSTDESFEIKDTTRQPLNGTIRLGCDSQTSLFSVIQMKADTLNFSSYQMIDQKAQLLSSKTLPPRAWPSDMSPRYVLLRNQLNTRLVTTDDFSPLGEWEGHLFSLTQRENRLFVLQEINQQVYLLELIPSQKKYRRIGTLSGGLFAVQVQPHSRKSWGISLATSGEDLVEFTASDSSPWLPFAKASLEALRPSTVSEATENYSAWETLLPTAWVPSFLLVPNGFQIGAYIPAFDLAQKNFIDLTFGYDSRGLPFGDLSATHRFSGGWQWNVAANFTPVYLLGYNVFLKNWSGSVGVAYQFNTSTPFQVGIKTLFKKLEPTPLNLDNQSVGIQVHASLSHSLKQKTMSLSPTRGGSFYAQYAEHFKFLGSTDNYYSALGSYTHYFELLEYQTLLVSIQAGLTSGTTFLNSYFAAGGELLFSQSRNFFNNRGYQPLSFVGRRMINANLEYLIPLAFIERGIGYFPLKLKNVGLAFTSDVTTYDFGAEFRTLQWLGFYYYPSVGLELRSQWEASYYLPVAARLGFYRGLGDYGEPFYFTFGLEASL